MENPLDDVAGSAGGTHRAVEIGDASSVACARRAAAEAARVAALDETDAGRLAIVLTEAATNILKHAGHGELLMRPLAGAVELLALDRGPGMTDVSAALTDGHSTAGTSGTGLGAIRRLSNQFAIYSQPGAGSVLRVLVRKSGGNAPRAALDGPEFGAVCVPYPGEEVCGDGWLALADATGLTFALADGLGHGAEARVAAMAALDVLRRHTGLAPAALMELSHAALRPTRGAALALVRLDLARGALAFSGTGNISAVAYGTGRPADSRASNHPGSPHGNHPATHAVRPAGASAPSARECYPLVSRNGIVGHTMRGTQEVELAWNENAVLVLHSDGIGTRWDLAAWPGLVNQPAAVIAAVLYRDFARRRDDATIVVVRARPGVQWNHEHAPAAHPA